MAYSINPNFHTYDTNLETFTLVWLDERVNTKDEYRDPQEKLRSSINYLRTFDNKEHCKQYILSTSPQDRIIFIINGRWAQQLIPDIHNLRQISSIHIDCKNKEKHEQWAKNYTKIKSITVYFNDLITEIKSNLKVLVKTEEPLTYTMFTLSKNANESSTGLYSQFAQSLLIIDLLLRLKSTNKDKQELIDFCKNEYKNNKTQLAFILDFERHYASDSALWWYLRDSFISKMLNKALRIQNVHMMYLFDFFIRDIYEQLQQYQCKAPVRLYRGQVMSTDELNNLAQSIGNLISMNSFFLTITSREQAVQLFDNIEISKDLHQVLFVIDADPRVMTTKPFGDVSRYTGSNHTYESEVMFMIGSVFRLLDIHREDDDDGSQIYVIKMELYGENESDMKKIFDEIRYEYGRADIEVSFRIFGDVVRKRSEFEVAEKVYSRALYGLASDDPLVDYLYWALGIVNNGKGNYDSGMRCFQKSLELKKENGVTMYTDFGNLYNGIGECYRLKLDYDQAFEWYNKAIEAFKQIQKQNHPDMAHIYYSIALVYETQERHLATLNYNTHALNIRTTALPRYHPDLAKSHYNIGNAYFNLRQYDHALNHYNQALEIQRKLLSPNHPDIATIYTKIGTIYEKKKKLKKALTYYQKADTICHQSLPPQHPCTVFTQNGIQRLSSQLK